MLIENTKCWIGSRKPVTPSAVKCPQNPLGSVYEKTSWVSWNAGWCDGGWWNPNSRQRKFVRVTFSYESRTEWDKMAALALLRNVSNSKLCYKEADYIILFGFIWFKLDTTDRFLGTRQWIFGFSKVREISWPDITLFTSKEDIRITEVSSLLKWRQDHFPDTRYIV
jgi:hypothetical protein